MNAIEKEQEHAKAIHSSLMSSDESDNNEDESVLATRPLQWRAKELNGFFRELNARYYSGLSPAQKRMMSKRVIGEESSRPQSAVPAHLQQWITDEDPILL